MLPSAVPLQRFAHSVDRSLIHLWTWPLESSVDLWTSGGSDFSLFSLFWLSSTAGYRPHKPLLPLFCFTPNLLPELFRHEVLRLSVSEHVFKLMTCNFTILFDGWPDSFRTQDTYSSLSTSVYISDGGTMWRIGLNYSDRETCKNDQRKAALINWKVNSRFITSTKILLDFLRGWYMLHANHGWMGFST